MTAFFLHHKKVQEFTKKFKALENKWSQREEMLR